MYFVFVYFCCVYCYFCWNYKKLVLSAVFHSDYLLTGGAVEPSGELSLLHRDESVRLDSQHGAHHEGPGPA